MQNDNKNDMVISDRNMLSTQIVYLVFRNFIIFYNIFDSK